MRPAGLLPTFGIILLLLHCPSSSSAAARRGRKRAAAAAAARADHGAGARGAATGPTVADLVRLATARGIDGRAVDAAMKTEDPRQSLLERIFFEPDPPSLYPLHTLEADPAGQPREVAFSDGHRATLSPAGFPSPKVFRVEGMLKAAEADGLVAEANAAGLEGSRTDSGPTGGDGVEKLAWRNSAQTWISKAAVDASALTLRLNQRAAELTKIPLAVIADGAIQVVKYRPGEHYYPHYDSHRLEKLGLPNIPPGAANSRGLGFPYSGRFITLVLFLSDLLPEDGGSLCFPLPGSVPLGTPPPGVAQVMGSYGSANPKAADFWKQYDEQCLKEKPWHFRPKKGDALLWYNHAVGAVGDPASASLVAALRSLLRYQDGRLGEMDPMSFHGGCSLAGGEKWIANYWIEVSPPFTSTSV